MTEDQVFDVINEYILTHDSSDPISQAIHHLIAEIRFLKWGVIVDLDGFK